jgi:hypothetical protein
MGLFNFGEELARIRLLFPVSIFGFSAKFSQISESYEPCNFKHFEAQNPGPRYNPGVIAAK